MRRSTRYPIILRLSALLVVPLGATPLMAQAPETLTLEEALRLARENNPNFLSQRNDQAAADWGVREAYGQFLPNATASGSMGYTEAGTQRIGTLDFGVQSTDWYSSSYRLALSWSLNGNTLFGVSNARASQRATAATIDAAAFDLESAVTLQYMATLRARDGVEVARRQLDRAETNLELVRLRVDAGAAAATEGRQAEVDRGRAEVALIQARQLLETERLRLMEQIGLPMEEEVELVSAFEVFEPGWGREELVDYALDAHPALLASSARETASRAGVRQARSAYFPSFQLSTAFSGNTLQALNNEFLVTQAENSVRSSHNSCRRWQLIQDDIGEPLPGIDLSEGCGSGVLTEADRQAVLASNEVFPFNFTKNPLSLTLSATVPIFNGFSRQRQLEEAHARADDATHARRAEELRLRRAVTQAHGDLMAAYSVVQIEARNQELAAERLEMAQQRYSIGAAPGPGGAASGTGNTYLELLDALASLTTAERDHLDALYRFHQTLAQLEAATGRTLRPPTAVGGEG